MNDLPDSYANHPISLAEVKSNKTGRGRDWTPRDALIDLLREIDSGRELPDALVILYRVPADDGHYRTRYRNATPDPHTSAGLVTIGHQMILRDMIT